MIFEEVTPVVLLCSFRGRDDGEVCGDVSECLQEVARSDHCRTVTAVLQRQRSFLLELRTVRQLGHSPRHTTRTHDRKTRKKFLLY